MGQFRNKGQTHASDDMEIGWPEGEGRGIRTEDC